MALVGASRLVKGVENSSDRDCAKTEITEIVRDVGPPATATMDRDADLDTMPIHASRTQDDAY